MAFADYIAERMLKGTPIAPQQQTPQPQQQQQLAEMPSADPASRRITATRITPDDIAMDMLGQAFSKQMNLLTQTSDDVYQSAYQTARQAGSTMDEARQFAREKASSHQNRRVDALSNAFLQGGVDENGTITRDGVGILAQIAQERPEMVNMLGNMYQTPQGATKYAQDIAKMMQHSDLSLRNTLEAQRQAADLREQAAQAAFGRQWQMLTAKQQMDIEQKFQVAEILSQATGQPAQSFIPSLFGVGGNGGIGGGRTGGDGSSAHRNDDAKADKEHFARLDKWLERYEKTNRDSITGEWREGTGPGDSEYDDRLEQYNRYTAKQYDPDNYEDAIRITQSLIDRGYPAEGISKYIDENFGELAPHIKKDLNIK